MPTPIGPNAILQSVLAENLGLAKIHSPNDTQVIFASPERIALQAKAMKDQGFSGGPGQLEYWPKDETGMPGYPHPSPGKTVLEIYSQELQKDPVQLKNAIYGDLMHGMVADPVWSHMRSKFGENYTPEELKRISEQQSWWEDANGTGGSPNAATDSYIRGWLNEPGVAQQGQLKNNNTMYSPKQLEILGQMQSYLKTGKEQLGWDTARPEADRILKERGY